MRFDALSHDPEEVDERVMRKGKLIYEKLFCVVSVLATLFVLAEIVMQSLGKSICPTEGCRVVAQQVRYGEISILLIGISTFFLLSLFSAMRLSSETAGVERFINLILVVSLAGEGFFAGYQAFSIRTPCVFCLIILGIMSCLGLIRLLAGEKDVLAGFVSMAAVFGMFYLVPPAGAPASLPENERLILFFSKECKHCAEVIKNLDENKITTVHLEAAEYSGFLKSMGIEHVPTLFVNDPYQKVFLTGKEAIGRYVATCREAAQAVRKTAPAKTGNPSEAGEAGAAIDLFSPAGIFQQAGDTAPEEGMCKEDQICK